MKGHMKTNTWVLREFHVSSTRANIVCIAISLAKHVKHVFHDFLKAIKDEFDSSFFLLKILSQNL